MLDISYDILVILKLGYFIYPQCVLANQICLEAIAIQPTHSMHADSPEQRRTSSKVVCRIQSMCHVS